MTDKQSILSRLPGKNCGICGSKTCDDFSETVISQPDLINNCIFLDQQACATCTSSCSIPDEKITWKDNLGRDYDFILDKFPGDPGPRETILPFNPTVIEKLGIKKGDVLYGRPGWISCGCPVSHVGIVVEEPDYFNGTVVWCIVGPMLARERGINIGYYNTTAYEGLVTTKKEELQIGIRYYFLPRSCMLQWRHCGLVNSIGKNKDGLRVRIEGLWIG
jgi:uncharacterized protein